MKHVAVFGLPLEGEVRLGDYMLRAVGRSIKWPGMHGSVRQFITHGLSGVVRQRLVLEARGIDELYRQRDRLYMSNCSRLFEEVSDADAVVFFTYPFLHPEMIARQKGARKFVMGFVDDPHSTYVRGLPYAWAYDAVFYISPSYSAEFGSDELLQQAGLKRRYWLPLVQPVPTPVLTRDDVLHRGRDICYVGNPTFSKVDRLAEVRRAFGNRFVVHGRWPFRGYAGFLRPLVGERGYYRRVSALTSDEKRALYLSTKIALNMHVSDGSAESGNMRTYEAASHGMLLLCDRGAGNLQSQIFQEDTQAVYYDDITDAIAKARAYLKHDDRRAEVAYNGYLRAREQYSFETVWHAFCEWIFSSS